MSEKRRARLSERRNHSDLQINMLAEQDNTDQLRVLRLLWEKNDIAIPDPEGKVLEESANRDESTRHIVESVEGIKHISK